MDESTKTAIGEIIARRIAVLTTVITQGHEYTAEVAAIHLAKIGTIEASNALMELIEKAADEDARDILTDALVSFSPLRNEYRDRLSELYSAQDLAALYVIVREQKTLTDAQPLWQEIAEALEADFSQRLQKAERAGNAGILLVD